MWVVGEAAANLDANGHFVYPEPTPPAHFPMISRKQAAEFGLAFIRTFITNPNVVIGGAEAGIVNDHGALIDFENVQVGRHTAFYVETSFMPIPDDLSLVYRRIWGPWYLVPLHSKDHQVAVIEISSYLTDHWIDEGGFIRMPRFSGNNFRWWGISRYAEYVVPLSPEHAVEFVGKLTDAMTTARPILVNAGARRPPVLAQWQMLLDRPVEWIGDSSRTRYSTRQVFVGLRFEQAGGSYRPIPQFYLPTAQQPDTIDITLDRVTDPETLQDVGPRSFQVMLRRGYYIYFEAVTPLGR
jgi:hypothetical protein